MITASTLSGVHLFAKLAAEDRERLAARITARNVAKGEFIIHSSDQDRDVYFVVSGSVRATVYSISGKQVTFQDLSAGDMFGELAAVDGLSRSTDVVALSDCTIGVMHHDDFTATCNEYADVATQTMQRLASLVRMLLERVFEFSTLGVNNRIHAELLRIARKHPANGNTVTIDAPPTHEEIASRVSTHREAVTRELKRLEAEGLITWGRKEHRINDLHELSDLVKSVVATTSVESP